MNTQNDEANREDVEILATNFERLYLEYKELARNYERINEDQANKIGRLTYALDAIANIDDNKYYGLSICKDIARHALK